MKHLDLFTQSYVDALLWASCDITSDDDSSLLDLGYTWEDFSETAKASIIADCESFQQDNADILPKWYSHGETPERAGHDFFLTRNRHGAGFWDRFAGGTEAANIGHLLTDASHTYGETNYYIHEDVVEES